MTKKPGSAIVTTKKSKAEYNEYMKVYMARRYERRKRELTELLGGACVICGSSSNLEFDHIDPKTKTVTIGKRLAGLSEEKLQLEIPKLQLLCSKCHEDKSIVDRGHTKAKGTHGTISAYRYCKCALCKEAKNIITKENKKKRKHASMVSMV